MVIQAICSPYVLKRKKVFFASMHINYFFIHYDFIVMLHHFRKTQNVCGGDRIAQQKINTVSDTSSGYSTKNKKKVEKQK